MEMHAYAVSGKAEPGLTPEHVNVTLTIMLKSKMETRKMDVNRSVQRKDPSVKDFGRDFGDRAADFERAAVRLAQGDASVGKFFLREAIDAYGAVDKLRPEQIEEALTGAFLVSRIHEQ